MWHKILNKIQRMKKLHVLTNHSNYLVIEAEMINPATGQPSPALIAFSYNTMIAVKFLGDFVQVILTPKHNYSVTTVKHRNRFLNETSQAVNKKIETGEYLVQEL